MLVDLDELVGSVEVTTIFGTSRTTVFTWIKRGIFPEPLAIISGTRLWRRADVIAWGYETGRLPPPRKELPWST